MFFDKNDIREMIHSIGDRIVWTPQTGRAREIMGIIEHRDIMHTAADESVMVAGQEVILHASADDLAGLKAGDGFRLVDGPTRYKATPLPSDGSGFLELSLTKVPS